MERRLLGTVLWLLFVPLAGAAWLVWEVFRAFVWMRRPWPIAVVGLIVALRMPNPLTAQIPTEGLASLWQSSLPWIMLGFGTVTAALGVRTRTARLLRRFLAHQGWFLLAPSFARRH